MVHPAPVVHPAPAPAQPAPAPVAAPAPAPVAAPAPAPVAAAAAPEAAPALPHFAPDALLPPDSGPAPRSARLRHLDSSTKPWAVALALPLALLIGVLGLAEGPAAALAARLRFRAAA